MLKQISQRLFNQWSMFGLVCGLALLLKERGAQGLRPAKGLDPSTPLSRYPAKDLCSNCGLCKTSYISSVRTACAFIEKGWSRIAEMEESVHGRKRKLDDEDELYFGVMSNLKYARMTERVEKSAWTGIVTAIAAEAVEQGVVDVVVGVGRRGDGPFERMMPRAVVCRTAAEVLASCPGVKPVIADTLSVLEDLGPTDKRLLFLGVGCQVRALRALKLQHVQKVYVLGTNCADNVRSSEALETFLRAVSKSPETCVGFEFMQSYAVDVKHVTDLYERVPVFSLPSADLKNIIAPSCYSCFDYSNALADIVVGYMATPYEGVPMTNHSQYIIVRNDRGKQLLDLVADRLQTSETTTSRGLFGRGRFSFAKQVAEQDLDGIFLGGQPKIWSLPAWIAELAAKLLTRIGPVGMEFAKSSIDYHALRNAVYLRTKHPERAKIIPEHARRIESEFYPGFTDELVQRYAKGGTTVDRNAR